MAAGQQFLVAVNNYRQSGGGGFPHIATAPVVYNAQVAIREAIVSYASAAGTIDPATFHVENWRLVRNGTPVFYRTDFVEHDGDPDGEVVRASEPTESRAAGSASAGPAVRVRAAAISRARTRRCSAARRARRGT